MHGHKIGYASFHDVKKISDSIQWLSQARRTRKGSGATIRSLTRRCSSCHIQCKPSGTYTTQSCHVYGIGPASGCRWLRSGEVGVHLPVTEMEGPVRIPAYAPFPRSVQIS